MKAAIKKINNKIKENKENVKRIDNKVTKAKKTIKDLTNKLKRCEERSKTEGKCKTDFKEAKVVADSDDDLLSILYQVLKDTKSLMGFADEDYK